jgi:hypothetical protein
MPARTIVSTGRTIGALRALLPTAGLVLACGAVWATPALASSAPTVGGESLSTVTEHSATLQAEIDPDGLETEYEFLLEYCRAAFDDGSCDTLAIVPVASGKLPAGIGDVPVSAQARELEPGHRYTFVVIAANAAGQTSGGGREFTAYESGGNILQTEGQQTLVPENKGTPFEPKPELWEAESALAGAARQQAEMEREERERTERQWLESPQYKEEQERREVQAREARAQAEEAAQRPAAAAVRCRVPALLGDSLTAARAALHRSDCRLGRVARPRVRHGELVVIRQSRPRGAKLASGSAIAVVLAPRRTPIKT